MEVIFPVEYDLDTRKRFLRKIERDFIEILNKHSTIEIGDRHSIILAEDRFCKIIITSVVINSIQLLKNIVDELIVEIKCLDAWSFVQSITDSSLVILNEKITTNNIMVFNFKSQGEHIIKSNKRKLEDKCEKRIIYHAGCNWSRKIISHKEIDHKSEKMDELLEYDTTDLIYYDFSNFKTIKIKARMAAGKTQSLIQSMVKQKILQYMCGIIITTRLSQASDFFKKYFEYFEINDYKSNCVLETNKILIVQYDSIWKLSKKWGDKKMFVILDEMESISSHSQTSTVKFPKECFNTMENIAKNAEVLVVMDADIGFRTNNFVNNLGRNKEDSIYIINKNKFKGKKLIIHNNKNLLIWKILEDVGKIKESLDNNEEVKRLFIPTDSLADTVSLRNLIKNKFGDSIKILTLTSDSSEEELSTMQNVNKKWLNYHIVLCTSTLGPGVSFTEKGFYKTYCLFTGLSIDYKLAKQIMLRVRDIASGEYHIHIDEPRKSFYFNKEQFELAMIQDETHNPLLFSVHFDEPIEYDKLNKVYSYINKDGYYHNYVDNRVFKSINDNNFKEHVFYDLHEQGFEILDSNEEIDEIDEKEIKEGMKEIKEKIKNDNIDQLKNSKTIDKEEFDELERKQRKNKDEKLAIEKFTLNEHYGVDIEKIDNKKIEVLSKENIKKAFKNINNEENFKITELTNIENDNVIAIDILRNLVFRLHETKDVSVASLIDERIDENKLKSELDKLFFDLYDNFQNSKKNLDFNLDYRKKLFNHKIKKANYFLRKHLGVFYKRDKIKKEYVFSLINEFSKSSDKIITK